MRIWDLVDKRRKKVGKGKRALAERRRSVQQTLNSLSDTPQKQLIEVAKEPPRTKNIFLTNVAANVEEDELVLNLEFKLASSQHMLSKIRSDLYFDGQKVKSFYAGLPGGFGRADEFQLRSMLDLRGISVGLHSVKVEMYDLSATIARETYAVDSKEVTFDYSPLKTVSVRRTVPRFKKVESLGVDFVSHSEKDMYHRIREARKQELVSERDKW